jgi:hypothetical protein
MRSLFSLFALFLTLAAVGCGGSAGLTPVSGKVTLDGQPLTGASGTIMFVPAGDSGAGGMASLNSDGTYQAKTGSLPGLQPGEYDLSVTATEATKVSLGTDYQKTEPKSLIPEKYNNAKTSGLKVKVEGSSKSHEIVLKKS